MNTTNRYRLASLALMAALAMTACAQTEANPTASRNEALAREVATAPAVQPDNVNQNPEFGLAEPKATVPAPTYASIEKPKVVPLPADGVEYKMDLAAMTHAIQTNNPGEYVGLPTGFTATGYPVFPATCTFYDDHSECEVNGEAVDEAYLANKVVVMRNIDVLNTDAHTCGTEICVDNDGNVIGHVSKQMIAWRKANCTWAPYGTAKCKQ